MKPIRILLTDDHTLVREGLKGILNLTEDILVAGEAANGAEALRLLASQAFDMILLDMSMPGRDGVELIKHIKEHFPEIPILVLTMHGEHQYAVRAFRAGAKGYLTKDSAATEMVQAVRKIAAGGIYINVAMAEKIAIDLSPNQDRLPHTLLSDREFSVFSKLADGKTNTEIAASLFLSVKTVSTYKTRIFEKMQLKSQTDLVKYAIKHGLFNEASFADPSNESI